MRYGYAAPQEKAEIVSLRSATIGMMPKPPLDRLKTGIAGPDAAFRGERPVFFSGTGMVSTPTFDRTLLEAGNRIAGPALVEEARALRRSCIQMRFWKSTPSAICISKSGGTEDGRRHSKRLREPCVQR